MVLLSNCYANCLFCHIFVTCIRHLHYYSYIRHLHYYSFECYLDKFIYTGCSWFPFCFPRCLYTAFQVWNISDTSWYKNITNSRQNGSVKYISFLPASLTLQSAFVCAGSVLRLLWGLYYVRMKQHANLWFFHISFSFERTDTMLWMILCCADIVTGAELALLQNEWDKQVTAHPAVIPDLDVSASVTISSSLFLTQSH